MSVYLNPKNLTHEFYSLPLYHPALFIYIYIISICYIHASHFQQGLGMELA